MTNLEEFVDGLIVTLEVVEGRTIKLEVSQDQLKRYMAKALNANADAMQGAVNIIVGEMKKKNNALKAM